MTDRSTIHAILVAARKRIENPANWCQEWHFLFTDGTPWLWSSVITESGYLLPGPEQLAYVRTNVARCCADGAILLEVLNDQSQAYIEAEDIMRTEAQRLYGMTYSKVNDSEDGHAKVLKVFDAAIAWASEAE
ncbi:DUF6197 family protein [Bradyrhizobium ottawaense]|uniref:Uncharacterized protein n=1 Tax=Bradyrhizobium ottawaense TaxID=931866 RepID=A0ABY0QHA6_9BRAD|nr:hypothetical protein [Bradyrhizobium ottawaense]SDK43338.1 hypothetical protein SAMN05444163_8100 [Bradyrhizobium ottawaense]